MAVPDQGLRHRKDAQNHTADGVSVEDAKKARKNIGRTSTGAVFNVPHTTDMASTILDPRQPKTEWDLFIIGTIALYITIFFSTSGTSRKVIFLALFAFWRAAYNVGIGFVLYQQSNHNILVRLTEKYRLFDPTCRPRLHKFIRRQLTNKMGNDYNFDESPIEYQTWLLFRRGVDLILMLDFCSYLLMAMSWSYVPQTHGVILHSLRWVLGLTLVFFNLWVKLDANRVLGDGPWYWNDFFFLVDADLTFDGVYELCMHPMYSLGYAGFYGISLLACSYSVLFTSIIAHISQFVFLYVVEEPHINKTYNPKSPVRVKSRTEQAKDLMSTEKAFHTNASRSQEPEYAEVDRKKEVSIFRPFDPYRVVDLTQILVISLGVTFAVFTPQDGAYRAFAIFQAFVWRLLHSAGLIYSLKGQSDGKIWTKHFLKFGDSPRKAWHEWKSIYTLSLTMLHTTFLIAAWKSYSIPSDWQYGMVTLRHVLGFALVGMHIWTSVSIYDVLGDFGWYFGDFFVDEKVPKLKYTGVYRYLNNPERVVYSFWGCALMANSTEVIILAAEAQLLNLLFLNFIEAPHMRKLYGNQVRKEAGFTKSLKTMPVVDHPHVKRTVEEIEGTLDRIIDAAIRSVCEIMRSAKPHLNKAVQEGRVRISRSINSVTITRVADNLQDMDLSQYKLELLKVEGNSYELGEPIQVKWRAPHGHARRDWIGIYRITDNLSKEITKVSSKSRWTAVHADAFIDHNADILSEKDDEGIVEFRGDTLPWVTGAYELRYHHDGKHNVMSISPPFEIKVTPSLERNYYKVERELLELIGRILESEKGIRGPTVAEDEIVFSDADDAEKYASRVAYGIHKRFDIDFAWQLIASDASVRNITARIARSRKILAPFVQYTEEKASVPT